MAATGYGIVETGNGAPGYRGGPGRLIECGVITFSRRSSLPRRLAELHAEIVALIDRHHPAALALENAFYHRNVRTTLVLGRERSEEHTSELQSRLHLVCRLLLEKKKRLRPDAIEVGDGSQCSPGLGCTEM